MHTHVGHSPSERTSRVLRVSLFVTLAYIVLLVVAGIRAHSLALLSEAGHNLSDFFALLLSLFAVYLQSRPPSSTATYGYHRWSSGGPGECGVPGGSFVPDFLRGFRPFASPATRSRGRDDRRGSSGRDYEWCDCLASVSLRSGCEHSQRVPA